MQKTNDDNIEEKYLKLEKDYENLLKELNKRNIKIAKQKKDINKLRRKAQGQQKRIGRQKKKIKKQQIELKKNRRSKRNVEKRATTGSYANIERHQYSELIVQLSTMLYTRLNGGFRQIVKALETANKALGGILGKIPCFNTISNWVKKCGLVAYESAGERFKDQKYAIITDESMMIGSEKLLVTLGVSAEHQGRPLNCADADVLGMFVAESWNGVSICEKLKESSAKVGTNPLYVISDNASSLKKGIRYAEIRHYPDISHSLGMFLERAYKKESDFIKYLELMAETKNKHCMKKIAYLLPPKQRTISRFMNFSSWVKWSSKMLNVYDKQAPETQELFSFVPANKPLIDELVAVVTCVQSIEKACKNQGSSKKTIKMCCEKINQHILNGNHRMKLLGKSILSFFEEMSKLLSDTEVHNNSSDIIESIFGKYKSRKSPNKLNGVTSHILFIPIYMKLSKDESAKKFDFKAALENKRMREIRAWEKENLTTNLSTLRTKSLGKAS